jgi:hypothetical protein
MCWWLFSFHEKSSPLTCFFLEVIDLQLLVHIHCMHLREGIWNILEHSLNPSDIINFHLHDFFFLIKQITTFNISLVVHGTVAEKSLPVSSPIFFSCIIQYHFLFRLAYYWTNCIVQSEKDPYEVPKSIGIFRLLESPKDITTTSVAQRIMANHDAYVVISFLLLFSFLSEYLTNLWCLYSYEWLIAQIKSSHTPLSSMAYQFISYNFSHLKVYTIGAFHCL